MESCRIPGSDDYDSDLGVVESYTPTLDDIGAEGPEPVDSCRNALMAAQVHATLALAAATVASGGDDTGRTAAAWVRATSVPPPPCEHDGCDKPQSGVWEPYCFEHKGDFDG